MFDTPLDELKPKLEALGLRVDDRYGENENDAEVYFGEEKICELKYNDVECTWYVEKFAPFLCPSDEVLDAIEWHLDDHLTKKKQLTFTVTIEYGTDAPKPTAKAEKALAALVAKSITKLVPSKPKPKTVVVNGRRHSLRRAKVAR